PAPASTIVALGNYPIVTSSGVAIFPAFKAYDPYGNGAAGSTFNITSSDPSASFPTPITLYGDGTLSLEASFGTVGAQSLTATEATNPNVNTTVGINVGPWASVAAPPAQEPPVSGFSPSVYSAVNEPITYRLSAGGGGLPPGAVFTFSVNWGEKGNPRQIVTGPSGTTITHPYTTSTPYPPHTYPPTNITPTYT